MTRLILTADRSSAGAIQSAGRADLVVTLDQRFVSGPPPSRPDLIAFLAPRTSQPRGGHFLDHEPAGRLEAAGVSDLGLLSLVERYDNVELWMDSRPNDQLVLVWLLDHLRDHADLATKIVLRHIDVQLFEAVPEALATCDFRGVALGREHLDAAQAAWQAFRAPTPQAWFDLLKQNLSLLPQLRRCVREMLDELPGATTGLGASELRILELLSAGYQHPLALFPHHHERFQRRVYGYWEVGALLDNLARAPAPAVAGLVEGPFTLDLHQEQERFGRYKASLLSLTPFGEDILAGRADFADRNPIDRWWGGTQLTNANLWRWDEVLSAPCDRSGSHRAS